MNSFGWWRPQLWCHGLKRYLLQKQQHSLLRALTTHRVANPSNNVSGSCHFDRRFEKYEIKVKLVVVSHKHEQKSVICAFNSSLKGYVIT